MKKVLYILALIATAMAPCAYTYPTTMKVTKVDYQSDTLTLVTSTGFIYETNGVEDYMEGDLVSTIMFNYGTPKDITDDKVLVVRYSGF